jgi:integrase
MLVMKADPYFSDVVRFYLLTGIRRGDGPLLRKGVHVDLEARTLLLPQQKQRNTKRLMITDELLPVLRRLLAGADETGRFIHPHKADLSKRFTKYRKKAGLPAVITFHSLRHTFGSWLAQGGVGLATLQRLMGHSDARSTQGYVGAFDEGMRVALERLKLPEPGEGSHKYRTLLTVDLETLRN